jgi:hypothetical protein
VTVIVISLVVFLLAAAGLSLGLMLGRGAIRGGCRGVSASGDADPCVCAEPCPRKKRAMARAAELAEEMQS